MSDLTGEVAFATVLEQLTEARISERRSTELRQTADELRRDAERKRDSVEADLAETRRIEANRLPRLARLWTAADAVQQFIIGANGEVTRLSTHSDLVKALRDALAASRDDCDQVPF